MSHYMRLAVKGFGNVKASYLKKALKMMDASYDVKMIKNVDGARPSAVYSKNGDYAGTTNAVLMKGEHPTSIQFLLARTDNGKVTLDVFGEDYRSEYGSLEKFTQTLRRNYSLVNVEEAAITNNYRELQRHQEEDGTIVLRYEVAA